jgi:hypothetical protein
MKKLAYILSVSTLLLSTSCVQKAYKKTVTFILNVENVKDIKTVGLRGGEKPLSWRKDLEMTPLKKDSLYTATVTFLTGYKFTEVKFVVNGEFELKDKDNRKVTYGDDDLMTYEAVYNVEK